jgi:hypothetical protein
LAVAVLKYAPRVAEVKEGQREIVYSRQSHEEHDYKLRNTLLFPLIVLAVLAISVVAFSFFTTFPEIVIANYAIHRPYEFPSLLLFSITSMAMSSQSR